MVIALPRHINGAPQLTTIVLPSSPPFCSEPARLSTKLPLVVDSNCPTEKNHHFWLFVLFCATLKKQAETAWLSIRTVKLASVACDRNLQGCQTVRGSCLYVGLMRGSGVLSDSLGLRATFGSTQHFVEFQSLTNPPSSTHCLMRPNVSSKLYSGS